MVHFKCIVIFYNCITTIVWWCPLFFTQPILKVAKLLIFYWRYAVTDLVIRTILCDRIRAGDGTIKGRNKEVPVFRADQEGPWPFLKKAIFHQNQLNVSQFSRFSSNHDLSKENYCVRPGLFYILRPISLCDVVYEKKTLFPFPCLCVWRIQNTHLLV